MKKRKTKKRKVDPYAYVMMGLFVMMGTAAVTVGSPAASVLFYLAAGGAYSTRYDGEQ